MKVKEPAAGYLTKKKIFTYQDYLDLPNDGVRYEIINGELMMVPGPTTMHQDVSGNLAYELRKFNETHKAGKVYQAPIDVLLSDENVVQPDIIFISKKNFSIITKKNISGPPDLVIEIISPSTGYYDIVEKKELYERFGVKEYWIVDPIKLWVEIYILTETKFRRDQRCEKSGTIKSRVLEGFELTLGQIFGTK